MERSPRSPPIHSFRTVPQRKMRQRKGTSRHRSSSIAGSGFVGSLHLLLLLVVITVHVVSAQNNPQQVGYWEGPYELPIIAAAVANLADGNLLLWGTYDTFAYSRAGKGKTWTAVYDYRQPNVKPRGVLVATTGHDSTYQLTFCACRRCLLSSLVLLAGLLAWFPPLLFTQLPYIASNNNNNNNNNH
jgi:hypothetical protein